MLVYSVILFAVAALFGLYLISRVLGGQLPPWAPVILHGLFAASGLLVLLYAAFVVGHAPGAVLVAAVLLLIAALGGFALFSFQLRKQVPPKPLATIHALAAVTGFLTLCASVFGLV
ncbi:hypothetical protein [Allosphingosinicella sp.]|uniref:hypothetical protein n=1 Tax=Allosphingosinicella sp. TaxID=2823234 RepID=UPI00378497F4